MTIRIALLRADGVATREQTFESYASVGGGESDDFVVAGLPYAALFVSDGPGGASVQSGATSIALAPNQVTVLDVGAWKLQVTVFGGAHRTPGGCPRCGAPVSERASGGAYRSMVSREQTCDGCGTTVIELGATAQSIGAFSERPETEWVTVSVPMSCPKCSSHLTRTSLRTAHGVAEVERCVRCAIIVLEKKDRAVLGG